MKEKLFAVLDSEDIVIDVWMAKTLEEAELDNTDKNVIEITNENSPFYLNERYIFKK